jgi:hypothetical protein
MALLGGDGLLQAIVPCLQQLLAYDDDWDCLEESGYVKLKVAGGVTATKLRAIIPQSTVVRLLSDLILLRFRPLMDTYSASNGRAQRVLGGGKGGQTLDIASCAQFALEMGRDAEDMAAVGQMDVKNYHDSFDRVHLYRSMRRRGISREWAIAAIRIHRCARVRLQVRGNLTDVITRSKGALTGNCLAPAFGRMTMEDVFTMCDHLTEQSIFKLGGIELKPMAWSDNIVVFANSTRKAGRIMGFIEEHLYLNGGLLVKEGSAEIIPACSRILTWASVRVNGRDCPVIDSFKCLGFQITCNGNTAGQKSRTLGALRGLLASAAKRIARPGISQYCRARWWRAQINGFVGYNAAFIGPSKTMYRELEVIGNKGARMVASLPPRYLVGSVLDRVQKDHKICVAYLFSPP